MAGVLQRIYMIWELTCLLLIVLQILCRNLQVKEDVPYVIGLDKRLGNELNDKAKDYLKDFGAATASNGAVGLYHIDNLTPEAVESGRDLILPLSQIRRS